VFSDATHGGESPAGEKSRPDGHARPKPRVAALGVTAEEMADLAGEGPGRAPGEEMPDRAGPRREGIWRRSFWSFGG
jgi:hypothetical protein